MLSCPLDTLKLNQTFEEPGEMGRWSVLGQEYEGLILPACFLAEVLNSKEVV